MSAGCPFRMRQILRSSTLTPGLCLSFAYDRVTSLTGSTPGDIHSPAAFSPWTLGYAGAPVESCTSLLMVIGAQVKGCVARKRVWLPFLVIIPEERNILVSQSPGTERDRCPMLPSEVPKRGVVHGPISRHSRREDSPLSDKLCSPDLKLKWKSSEKGDRSPGVVLEGFSKEIKLDLALAINVWSVSWIYCYRNMIVKGVSPACSPFSIPILFLEYPLDHPSVWLNRVS